jgi:2-methylthioadenine synthetase
MKEFDDFIQFAYETVPDICIGTDVIVGFPGETDDLFQETEKYLRESPIHYFHVFSYSERDFARSKKLEGQVSPIEIAKRSQVLRELSQRKKTAFSAQFINSTQSILFEKGKGDYAQGLTENFIKVQVKTNQDLRNQILPVSLDDVSKAGLLGEIVSP